MYIGVTQDDRGWLGLEDRVGDGQGRFGLDQSKYKINRLTFFLFFFLHFFANWFRLLF